MRFTEETIKAKKLTFSYFYFCAVVCRQKKRKEKSCAYIVILSISVSKQLGVLRQVNHYGYIKNISVYIYNRNG